MRRKTVSAQARLRLRRVSAADGSHASVRTLKTAAVLRHLIQLRIDALADDEDEGDQLFARDVEWHAPDESGCNWDMRGYRGPAAYATGVRLIVNNLRREYRLAEDAARYW